jgi:hypothetical protein
MSNSSCEHKGVDFLSNMIILGSPGIDIIVGMDWLKEYNGVIVRGERFS